MWLNLVSNMEQEELFRPLYRLLGCRTLKDLKVSDGILGSLLDLFQTASLGLIEESGTLFKSFLERHKRKHVDGDSAFSLKFFTNTQNMVYVLGIEQ